MAAILKEWRNKETYPPTNQLTNHLNRYLVDDAISLIIMPVIANSGVILRFCFTFVRY